MIEVLTFAIVHDVQHPEEVEDAPHTVAAGQDLARNGRNVKTRVLGVIQDHPIDRHRPAAKFVGRLSLQEVNRCDGRLGREIGKG